MRHNSVIYDINLKLYIIILGMIMILLLLITMMENKKYTRISVYLPEVNTSEFSKEVRFIPKTNSKIEKIRWIMNELISGPLSSNHVGVFNPNTKIKNIFIERGVMYIDFDWRIMEAFQKNYSIAVTSIKKTIGDNLSGVKEIRLLINGIEPILYQGPIVLELR